MSDPFQPAPLVPHPATMIGSKMLMFLIGASGTGKTLTALKIARGLVGPAGKIIGIDTEQRRMGWHSDKVKFDVLDLGPPFSPARYIEYLDAAERAKPDAIIIDSGSHEHEGIGGMLEMADRAATKNDYAKWAFPKAEHKRFMNRLLQSPCHIIVCYRAREKFKQAPNPDKPGKLMVVNDGWHGIYERGVPFEAAISVMLLPREPDEKIGRRQLIKCLDELEPAFERPGWLGEDTGRAIAAYLDQSGPVDRTLVTLRASAEEASLQGVAALEVLWKGLGREQRLQLQPHLPGLKSAAAAVDAENQRLQEAANDGALAVEPAVEDGFWDRQSYEIAVLFNDWGDWDIAMRAHAAHAPNAECVDKLRADNSDNLAQYLLQQPLAARNLQTHILKLSH